MVVELPMEYFELWSKLLDGQAFDKDGRLDMGKFRALGGRMNTLQGLVNRGAVLRDGSVFHKNPGVEVVAWTEKVFDNVSPEDDDGESGESDENNEDVVEDEPEVATPKAMKPPKGRIMPSKEEVESRMYLLTSEQVALLRLCFRHTNWDRGKDTTSYRIRTAELCAGNIGITSQDVIDMLDVLGIPVALWNHSLPGFMKGAEVLPDGKMMFDD